MAKQIRVGLVGVGAISDWHVRAIRAVGMDVVSVSTRPGSKRLQDFAGRHAISGVYEDWRQMVTRADELDAVVIATHTDGTPDILDAFLPLGLAVLVEKPVAWSSSRLAALAARADARVIVGFNRRFYRPVEAARTETRNGPPLLAQLTFPEGVTPPVDDDPKQLYLQPFFENGCHGIDLARYILGDLEVETVRHLRSPEGRVCAIDAMLSTPRGDAVSLVGNWGGPANYSVALHRAGRRFELKPFEVATVYEGMDVLEPSSEWPIRRYVPRQTERIDLDAIDTKEKPGFVAQARALRRIAEGQPAPPQAATLEDARAAVALCEALSGVRYAL